MEVKEKLLTFVRPLLQDLDGASREGDAERIGAIAARVLRSSHGETRELLLLTWLHPIAGWLSKPGNFSRAAITLAPDVAEHEIRDALTIIRSLQHPSDPLAIAFASAIAIDEAGVRGGLVQLARARREGMTIDEAVEALLAQPTVAPPFLPQNAARWFLSRRRRRMHFLELCAAERELSDHRADDAQLS